MLTLKTLSVVHKFEAVYKRNIGHAHACVPLSYTTRGSLHTDKAQLKRVWCEVNTNRSQVCACVTRISDVFVPLFFIQVFNPILHRDALLYLLLFLSFHGPSSLFDTLLFFFSSTINSRHSSVQWCMHGSHQRYRTQSRCSCASTRQNRHHSLCWHHELPNRQMDWHWARWANGQEQWCRSRQTLFRLSFEPWCLCST